MIKNAKLIEFNDRLTPELLVTKPENEGYLAIFMFRTLEPTDGSKELVKLIFKSETNLIWNQSSIILVLSGWESVSVGNSNVVNFEVLTNFLILLSFSAVSRSKSALFLATFKSVNSCILLFLGDV
jgi:hypothetical protein